MNFLLPSEESQRNELETLLKQNRNLQNIIKKQIEHIDYQLQLNQKNQKKFIDIQNVFSSDSFSSEQSKEQKEKLQKLITYSHQKVDPSSFFIDSENDMFHQNQHMFQYLLNIKSHFTDKEEDIFLQDLEEEVYLTAYSERVQNMKNARTEEEKQIIANSLQQLKGWSLNQIISNYRDFTLEFTEQKWKHVSRRLRDWHWREMKQIWFYCLHPKYKETVITAEEKNRIKSLSPETTLEQLNQLSEELKRPLSTIYRIWGTEKGNENSYLTFFNSRSFSQNEKMETLKNYSKYGPNWTEISYQMNSVYDHKHTKRCYEESLDPVINRGRWSAEEDQLLIRAVQYHKSTLAEGEDIKWNEIEKLVRCRTATQCSGRYKNHLNPKFSKRELTAEEIAKLDSIYMAESLFGKVTLENIEKVINNPQQPFTGFIPNHDKIPWTEITNRYFPNRNPKFIQQSFITRKNTLQKIPLAFNHQ